MNSRMSNAARTMPACRRPVVDLTAPRSTNRWKSPNEETVRGTRAIQGWPMRDSGMILKVTTPTHREIVMTRTFDAPRELVFDALTKPELLTRWFGVFGGWSLAMCTVDLRVGGAYRFVWREPDGKQMGMSGVYREVVPPARYAGTESFDDPWYPGEALVTTVLVEQGGRTTVSCT